MTTTTPNVALVSPYRNCHYGFVFPGRRDQRARIRSGPGGPEQDQEMAANRQWPPIPRREGRDRGQPKNGQICLVHYTGWLWENNAKGKEFDSSVGRGEPFTFPVGRRQGHQGLG